jgi:cystathionine beta-lyase/cystathionine gamma-synthase
VSQEPASVPVSGSLSAKIIRKCPTHRDCPLTCKQRQVENLGEIASFDVHAEPASRSSFLDNLKHFFRGGKPS